MEYLDDTHNDYNLDMNDVPNEKLKVIVELDQNNLRVSCEGLCDVDKWRAAYMSAIGGGRSRINGGNWRQEIV